MKVVYTAGPFRAVNQWEIEQNVSRAEALAIAIAHMGAMPLCPHTMTRNWQGACPDQFWLDGTLELMTRCDAVLLTRNWEQSRGAKREYEKANEQGLRIYHEHDLNDLRQWVRYG